VAAFHGCITGISSETLEQEALGSKYSQGMCVADGQKINNEHCASVRFKIYIFIYIYIFFCIYQVPCGTLGAIWHPKPCLAFEDSTDL
jgi:hypothetical protein